mmetsp:Transcript_17270/g.38952  ORF Transcript_17270/g.38952 Transcript_17270/m.38952 type:complete len:458 (+) Transcript_17270:685-2058(+)
MTARGVPKPIELHGEVQIRRRQQVLASDRPGEAPPRLEKIGLRGMFVARMWDEGEAERGGGRYDHLAELDLAGNMLWEWDEAFRVLQAMPNLEALVLSGNLVRDLALGHTAFTGPFPSLRRLVLNTCNIRSWRTPLTLLRRLPNLKELLLAHNDLRDLLDVEKEDTPKNAKNACPHLTFLDLSDCDLTSWDQVLCLDPLFPNLETLVLDENSLADLTTTTTPEHSKDPKTPAPYFSRLRALQLSHNRIADWSVVDDIHRRLPSLRSLRFRHNPLTADLGASEARAAVVARCPSLECLNASYITTKERTEAERSYVRRVVRRLDAAAAAERAEILREHPRYETLARTHEDDLARCRGKAFGRGTLGEEAVNVLVRSMAVDSITAEPLHRRLPGSMEVGRLKQMCRRAFGLDVERIALHFKSQNDPIPIALEDDLCTLSYYGVTDGCEILMNEKELTKG